MNTYLQKHTKAIATPFYYKCTQKQQLQMNEKNYDLKMTKLQLKPKTLKLKQHVQLTITTTTRTKPNISFQRR
jgi:hypothetical protein